MVEIRNADVARDLEVVKALWLEYLSWGNEELEARFGFRFPIEKALEDDLASIAKFQPPGGRLLLAVEGDEAVGIACLRRMSPGIAEIKRMFVRPAQRGAGLGGALLDHLITEAKASGYQRIRLDSARFMETAHACIALGASRTLIPTPRARSPTSSSRTGSSWSGSSTE